MKIKSRWLVVFLVMGLVLAACSPSDGDSTDTTEAPAAATTTEASTDTTEAMTDTTEGAMEILTDVGVDLDAGTITVGLLSDLTGVFSALVQPVVDGYKTKVDDINASGGIHGLEIKLEVRDTVYSVDTHVQLYEELRNSVVMLGHSTGSPHSVAIAGALAEDNMLAVPLTWYSGWSDPALNANLMAASRVAVTMARDRTLPSVLRHVHPAKIMTVKVKSDVMRRACASRLGSKAKSNTETSAPQGPKRRQLHRKISGPSRKQSDSSAVRLWLKPAMPGVSRVSSTLTVPVRASRSMTIVPDDLSIFPRHTEIPP